MREAQRFWLQFVVIVSAVALTAGLVYTPVKVEDEILEILKQSLSVMWTLVAFIVRDIRNRDDSGVHKTDDGDS